MSLRFAIKTSFGHLQDVLASCPACLGKTSLRHLVDAFLSTWGKRGIKGRRKKEIKEEKNISFKFYLQVLVLVITDMHIQLCKY